ncbi:MAG TPA: zf-HC2 domain-containing protein, partial [Candidatus Eisenbacteria bacterium]
MDRLSPFLDDELDAVASREISRHVEACGECAAALERRRRLRESLVRDLEYHRAPDLLRARVARLATRKKFEEERHALGWSGLRKFEIAKKVQEGGYICSFYLRPHDKKPLPPFMPGQYL